MSFLAKEAEHVDGFAKECAVVTHHRLCAAPGGGLIPDPEAKLEVIELLCCVCCAGLYWTGLFAQCSAV